MVGRASSVRCAVPSCCSLNSFDCWREKILRARAHRREALCACICARLHAELGQPIVVLRNQNQSRRRFRLRGVVCSATHTGRLVIVAGRVGSC